MGQLATALLFSKSGLTRLIDRMVEAGLVQRLAAQAIDGVCTLR